MARLVVGVLGLGDIGLEVGGLGLSRLWTA
jgi:hypothetical protein